MRHLWKISLATACAAALACGSDSNNNNNNNTGDGGTADGGSGNSFTFVGSGATDLEVLPQAAQLGASITDMTKLRVTLVDPVKLLTATATGSANPVGAATLGGSAATPVATTANHASYTIPNVDRTTIVSTLGLVTLVTDTGSPQQQTTPTGTGVAAATTYAAGTGASVAASAPAFVIPDTFADKIAIAVLGAGNTRANLVSATTGYVLAFILDRAAGTPVTGATVAAVAGHTVTHLNVGPGGTLVKGTATDALGLVVISGAATGATPVAISATSATLPACTTTVATGCLAPAQAGILPGVAFVAPVLKQ